MSSKVCMRVATGFLSYSVSLIKLQRLERFIGIVIRGCDMAIAASRLKKRPDYVVSKRRSKHMR